MVDPTIRSDCADFDVPLPLQQLASRDILVTGASGMLGSYIVAYLHRLQSTLDVSSSRLIASTRQIPHGRMEAASESLEILEPEAALQRIGDLRRPVVIHAASPASPAKYVADPVGCMRVNVQQTERLAMAVGLTGGTLLYVSSGEVYGPTPKVPTSEEDFSPFDPTDPRWVYAEAKRAGEAVALGCWRSHGVDVRVARLFHTFGPGASTTDDRIFGALARAASDGDLVTLRGSGSATRTFLYSLDALTGFSYLVGQLPAGSVANVANHVCHRVSDVAYQASQILTNMTRVDPGREASALPGTVSAGGAATPLDSPTAESPVESPTAESWADNSKLRGAGWFPQVALYESLLRTLKSVRWRSQAKAQLP